jgi:Phosphotransferase enzyme family
MADRGTTHEVRIDRDRRVVIKRFRSWDRGEPAREWAALRLLARSAPGLAPAPLRADLAGRPATIEMSLLPGAELGSGPLSGPQLDALALALRRLWQSVPPAWQQGKAGAGSNSAAFTSQVRAMLASRQRLGADPLVARAAAAGAAWLASRGPGLRAGPVVLGHGDPNLANFLWDGDRIAVVDFEDSGPSDRAFELAILVEHISAWSAAGLDAGALLALFDLTSAEQARVREVRRLAALFWLILLRPGGPASIRNPAGTQQRQAGRLLTLLG